jgi:hypothetical protein
MGPVSDCVDLRQKGVCRWRNSADREKRPPEVLTPTTARMSTKAHLRRPALQRISSGSGCGGEVASHEMLDCAQQDWQSLQNPPLPPPKKRNQKRGFGPLVIWPPTLRAGRGVKVVSIDVAHGLRLRRGEFPPPPARPRRCVALTEKYQRAALRPVVISAFGVGAPVAQIDSASCRFTEP